MGTLAFWMVSGASPPSSVTPQPAIVALVPAAHEARSPAPATLVGALVALRESLSTEMSLPSLSR